MSRKFSRGSSDICFNFSKSLSLYRSSNSWLSHLHRNTSSHLGRTDGHLLKIWGTSYGTVPAGLSLIPGVQLKQEPPRSYENKEVQPCNSHISMKTPGYLSQAVLIQQIATPLFHNSLLNGVFHEYFTKSIWKRGVHFLSTDTATEVAFLEKWKVSLNNVSPRLGIFLRYVNHK